MVRIARPGAAPRFRRLTFLLAACAFLANAQGPSGRIVWIQADGLWLRQLPGGPAIRISRESGLIAPKFSADGQWIAVRHEERLEADRLKVERLKVERLKVDRLEVISTQGGGSKMPLGSEAVPFFRWSPTGATLALSTEKGVFLASAANGWTPTKIFPGYATSLAFNPDGALLAVATEPEGAEPRSGAIDILTTGDPHAAPKRIYREADNGMEIGTWTRDGKSILLWKDPDFSGSEASDGLRFYAIPAAGGEPRYLETQMLLGDDVFAWSPDGARLAISDGWGRSTWTDKHIVLLDPGKRTKQIVSDIGDAAFFAAWSPSGREIAFSQAPAVRNVGGGPEAQTALARRKIWVIGADGSGERQITSDPAYRDEAPLWFSDTGLVFCRLDSSDRASVWWIATTGGEPHRIADNVALSETGWFGYYGRIDWRNRFDYTPR